MRFELKHDKLAAQIYNLASAEAKARRKAENIYQMYYEIGATRLFTKEELEYLAQFQPVLQPKDSLQVVIDDSKEELDRLQREEEEKEKARLERERELIRRIKLRQQRISWIIAVAAVIVAGLLFYAFWASTEAAESERIAGEIRQNLEQKRKLTEDLKEELSASILEKAGENPAEATAYVKALNEKYPSIFIDDRDWDIYEIIQLQGEIWMSENLRYKPGAGSWFYENKEEYGKTIGRLYNWEAAGKACPQGWHLPTALEWRKLAAQFGGVDFDAVDEGVSAYNALIAGGSSNFNARLGGSRRSSGNFYDLGENGDYWSATEGETHNGSALLYRFDRETASLRRFSYSKTLAASCRCVRD